MKKLKHAGPVREVARNNHYSKGGYLISRKMGRVVETESRLERDHYMGLEIRRDVMAYCEQPTVFTYVLGGQIRRYTPDVWVQYQTHDIYQEVKPFKFLNMRENQIKYGAIAEALKARGIRYEFVTERDVNEAYPRFVSSYLLRFADCIVDASTSEFARTIMMKLGQISIGQLKALLGTASSEFNAIVKMASLGQLSVIFDLNDQKVEEIILGC